jgi:non-haem Fe2+, alpha-ketoglutarate-dependent halogenase
MATTIRSLKRLTRQEVEQYHALGYVKGFRVFRPEEVTQLQQEYEKLVRLLPPGRSISRVNWWHKRNRFVYDLCMDARLLDYVEDILGPNFFLWGSHFFVKEPSDGTIVPWHQDAQYWPLTPQNAVTEEIDPASAVDLELQAGEISLHHDGLAHGSGANLSSRRRVGFTMRFSSTDVKCDLSVWPNFQAFLARGVDEYGHNPVGVPPTGYEAPHGMLE